MRNIQNFVARFGRIIVFAMIIIAGQALTSCSSSGNRRPASETTMSAPATNASDAAKLAALEAENKKLAEELHACPGNSLKQAQKLLLDAKLAEKLERAENGLDQLNLEMFASFAGHDSDLISPDGFMNVVNFAHNGEWESPISSPRTSIGTMFPGFGMFAADEANFMSVRDDLRNPARVNKFWDKNKTLVIFSLKVSGQLGIASTYATDILRYYENKIDKDLAKACKAYYDKHKNAGSFEDESPEYKALAAFGKGGHAKLQTWLFVQRNRDAGGDALIKAHIRVLRDLANPV